MTGPAPLSSGASAGNEPTPDGWDDVGVRLLAPDALPWVDVPEDLRRIVATASTADQVVEALIESPAWSDDLGRALLHPASGGVAVLAPPTNGRALELCSGRHGLGPALASLGAQVTRADVIYERLRFQQLAHPTHGSDAVLVDLASPLPWRDQLFDLVFVRLEEILAAVGPGQATQVLAEVRRVLVPSGTVVVDARSSGRARLDALGEGNLRRATGRSSSAMLSDAGLIEVDRYVHLPDRRTWADMVHRRDLRRVLGEREVRTGAKRAVAVALRRTGASGLLAPDHIVIARPAGGSPPGPGRRSLAASTAQSDRPVVSALSDARVAVLGRRFAKVPLSEDQQRALLQEATNTDMARNTPFGRFVEDSPTLVRTGDVEIATYARLDPAPSSLVDAAAILVDALHGVDEGLTTTLSSTAVWRRLSSSRGQRYCEEMSAVSLRQHVLATCGDLVVPVGPTHGDLHPDNVLVTADGQARIIDWNRFEPDNPLVLDPAYAAIQVERARDDRGLPEAFAALWDGLIPGELAQIAGARRGALAPPQVAALVLLDRVVSYSLPRRRYKPWTITPLREAVDELNKRLPRP